MLVNKKSNSGRGGSGGSLTGSGSGAIVGGSGAGDSEGDGGSSLSSHRTDVEVLEALDGDSLEGGPSARQPQFRYVIQVSRTD